MDAKHRLIAASDIGEIIEVVTSGVAIGKNLKMYIRGAMFSEGLWVLQACTQGWCMHETDAKHR
jgi:hypothetical protein